MAGEEQQIAVDKLLAAVLRGDAPALPTDADPAVVVERILYHGIAGLIAEQARGLGDWPSAVIVPLREQAVAQAMWELRHRPLLAGLLDAFADAGVRALLLKGSALAYDLYPEASTRSRGDSDVLVASAHVSAARRTLEQRGFVREINGMEAQEEWSIIDQSGSSHVIDMHWQLLNAPGLSRVMPFAACAQRPLALARLGAGAMAMRRTATLLHTCIHRAVHLTTPYFVDGVTYYGGDRLIWASDIGLLAASLSEAEWDEFAAMALDQGVAMVALNGLDFAARTLGCEVPSRVRKRLAAATNESASAYLLSAGQVRRTLADWRAIPGVGRKLGYAAARLLPPARFMRSKYPAMAERPLAALYFRRVIDLFRTRRSQGERR